MILLSVIFILFLVVSFFYIEPENLLICILLFCSVMIIQHKVVEQEDVVIEKTHKIHKQH